MPDARTAVTFAGYASKVLGSRLVSSAATASTRTRVRILAYHGISNIQRFEQHLKAILADFEPVTGRQVMAAYGDGNRLPDRALWVTFDDGHPEVVTAAMPLLDTFGITATMFVCPGVMDTDEPFWWEVVRVADQLGLTKGLLDAHGAEAFEASLKRCSDDERRDLVAQLRAAVTEHGGDLLVRPQLRSDQLRLWVDHRHEVGNHTWTHPLLDRCSSDEQVRQVNHAHAWLEEAIGESPTLFAYPNGNWAKSTERALMKLGYQVAVGFDHRLASVPQHDALRLSRLRIDGDAPIERFRAIASGIHPQLLTTRRRLLDRARLSADPRELPR